MKELYQAIRTDLIDLYENDKIENAVNFNRAVGKEFIAENFKPMYFSGNYQAKTVFVMLNPGSGMNNNYSFAKSDKSKYENVEEFINSYIDGHTNYGKLDFNRLDNFDLKQAAFLLPFKDAGIQIPDFTEDLNNKGLKLKAKESVLMNKLQLELIPYHSTKFDELLRNEKVAFQNIEIFVPHIKRLLNVISEIDRKYVIFGAKQFYYLFQAYNAIIPETFAFIKNKSFAIDGLKNKVNLSLVEINHNGKKINTLIAHSFPRRDLPNAFVKMKNYGELCFKELKNNQI
jgi:5'(3')-deoxyribonucleotidase